MSSSNYHFIR